MVTLWPEEQKINKGPGSIPTIPSLPKVDSAFHSLGGISEMSSRANGRLARLPFS